MNKTISILGCGWLGTPLAQHFLSIGYKVKGSTTSSEKLEVLNAKGIKASQVDIGNHQLNISDFLDSNVLVICINSKQIEDFKQLIKSIENSKVNKVIFISSTSVYDNCNGIVTEETVTNGSALAQIEQLFVDHRNFETTVLRFGGLFGYDRQPGRFMKPGRIADNPEGYVNLIHRDDCIAIIESIITKDVWSEVFNACASAHPNRRAFYTKEALKLGLPKPQFNENSTNDYKIISNEKLRKTLNYAFLFDDL